MPENVNQETATETQACQHYIIAEYLRIDTFQTFFCTRCGTELRLIPADHDRAAMYGVTMEAYDEIRAQLDDRAVLLREALSEALAYMQHKVGCKVWAHYCGDLECEQHCDCGYIDAIARLTSPATQDGE